MRVNFFLFPPQKKVGGSLWPLSAEDAGIYPKTAYRSIVFPQKSRGEFSFHSFLISMRFLLRHTCVSPPFLSRLYHRSAGGRLTTAKGGGGGGGKGTHGRTDGGGRNRKNGPCQVFFCSVPHEYENLAEKNRCGRRETCA